MPWWQTAGTRAKPHTWIVQARQHVLMGAPTLQLRLGDALVVTGALLRVGEHRVGLVQGGHDALRVRVAWHLVGVVALREPAIGGAHTLGASAVVHPQEVVVGHGFCVHRCMFHAGGQAQCAACATESIAAVPANAPAPDAAGRRRCGLPPTCVTPGTAGAPTQAGR
jgi:hypothetical protein